MKLLNLRSVLACALFAAIAGIPFLPLARTETGLFALEGRVKSSAGGRIQLYFDRGHGFNELDLVEATVRAGEELSLHLPLPPGTYSHLRLDPIDSGAVLTFESLQIASRTGRVVRRFVSADLHPANQIATLRDAGSRIEVVSTPTADDPQLDIPLSPVQRLDPTLGELTDGFWTHFLLTFGLLLAPLVALDRLPGLRARIGLLIDSASSRPGRAIAVVAAVAVILSTYPVIFLGKSHVSPNMGTKLLYDGFPTLPGDNSGETTDDRGSDIGAVMWSHLPLGALEAKALGDASLPLWNRYSAGGTPLLGQGQSMFGDPLHLLVIVAGSAAWAWDLKFLIAKWLFATGLGLSALRLTRHIPGALIVTLAAPFAGFFLYRVNHPAYFSLCYAPWVLYAWQRIIAAEGSRATAAWIGALVLANWSLLNSGTVKEAYMLLAMMNLAGAALFLGAATTVTVKLWKLAALGWAGLAFILLSAPVWLTFLGALQASYTGYDAASAYQIQPGMLLGAFDELFYRPLMAGDRVFNPSANFVILLGLLLFLATLRQHFGRREPLILAAVSLIPLSLAFGLVPPAWIVQLPFLRNVAHIDNTFTCVLLVLWPLLAAVGFRTAAERLGSEPGRGDLAIAGLLLLGLVSAWIASGHAVHRAVYGEGTTLSFLRPGTQIPVDAFIWGSLAALLLASAALGIIARRGLATGRLSPAAGVLAGLCAAVLLWRTGLHAAAAGFEHYTARPTPRLNFSAPSEAVALLQEAQRTAPSRTIGLEGNFFPGWTNMYALEAVCGPDALMNPFYRELTSAGPVQKIWDWRLYLTRNNLAASRPFLDFLNVRHYLDRAGTVPPSNTGLKVVRNADLAVLESPTVWPRAFFTNRLTRYGTVAEFVGQVTGGDGLPFAAMQDKDAAGAPALSRELSGRTVTPATNYRLTTNDTSFRVRASGPGIIVLSETFWTGDFRAELNGAKVPILRANHAFKGVAVPAAGDYEVTFRYVPRRWYLSLGLAALGGLMLAGGGFALLRRRVPPVPSSR